MAEWLWLPKIASGLAQLPRWATLIAGMIDLLKLLGGSLQHNKLLAEKCHLGFASRMRSEHSDERSAEPLQEVDHPEMRIAHRGICPAQMRFSVATGTALSRKPRPSRSR